eukprot:1160610-Pelagomonas_calceolata.AAC.2
MVYVMTELHVWTKECGWSVSWTIAAAVIHDPLLFCGPPPPPQKDPQKSLRAMLRHPQYPLVMHLRPPPPLASQAAIVSCLAFTLGAIIPILAGGFIADYQMRLYVTSAAATAGLALFGLTGAALGAALGKGRPGLVWVCRGRSKLLCLLTCIGSEDNSTVVKRRGGANVLMGSLRVVIGGWLAMAATFGIGKC